MALPGLWDDQEDHVRVMLKRIGRAHGPDWTKIADEIRDAMDTKIKPRALKYAIRVTQDWDHEPVWRAIASIRRGAIALDLSPTGPNKKYWIWTSRGTRPHKIRAKHARRKGRLPMLVFPSVYTPHTTPRGPSYGGPGTSSGPTVFAREVNHPGTKGRHFEEAWRRYMEKWFAAEIEAAVRRGVEKA